MLYSGFQDVSVVFGSYIIPVVNEITGISLNAQQTKELTFGNARGSIGTSHGNISYSGSISCYEEFITKITNVSGSSIIGIPPLNMVFLKGLTRNVTNERYILNSFLGKTIEQLNNVEFTGLSKSVGIGDKKVIYNLTFIFDNYKEPNLFI